LFAELLLQPIQFAPVEQQPPRPRRLMVLARREVRGDVYIIQPQVAVAEASITLGDVGVAGADRLDLGAQQGDAGVKLLEDVVLEAGTPVGGDRRASS
jgi:hypothetical protein